MTIDPNDISLFGNRNMKWGNAMKEKVMTSEISTEVKFRIGWYEFFRKSGTSHVMHVGESTYYFPEEGLTLDDFYDALKAGRAFRLVRAVDVEEALGVEPEDRTVLIDAIDETGKTTSELSPRQLLRARYGGPRGGSPQIGRD